jgi:hypothetical protein
MKKLAPTNDKNLMETIIKSEDLEIKIERKNYTFDNRAFYVIGDEEDIEILEEMVTMLK